MKNKDKKLQNLYDKMFAEMNEHMKHYEAQMVASTLIAIGMRLYKTNLSDDGFHNMVQTIFDSEKDIRSYADDEETLH